jgi:hypothetical protein
MKIYAAQGWQDSGYKPGAQRGAGAWALVRAEGVWNVNVNDPSRGPRDSCGRTPNVGNNWFIPTNADFPYSGEGSAGGQLICKIGVDGVPFPIERQCKISTADTNPDDTLWFIANDASDGYHDNDGALEVTFIVSNLEQRDPVAEKNTRIANYEKASGKKYTP